MKEPINGRLFRENNTIEIDFLFTDPKNPQKIALLEVKSGKNYTMASLNKMTAKFTNKLGQKYLLHTKDLCVEGDVIYLPVYMTIFI